MDTVDFLESPLPRKGLEHRVWVRWSPFDPLVPPVHVPGHVVRCPRRFPCPRTPVMLFGARRGVGVLEQWALSFGGGGGSVFFLRRSHAGVDRKKYAGVTPESHAVLDAGVTPESRARRKVKNTQQKFWPAAGHNGYFFIRRSRP